MYLLIAGDTYYPSAGTGDWQGVYESRELAEEQINRTQCPVYIQSGPNKGKIDNYHTLMECNGCRIDWYEIIDLNDWISNEKTNR